MLSPRIHQAALGHFDDVCRVAAVASASSAAFCKRRLLSRIVELLAFVGRASCCRDPAPKHVVVRSKITLAIGHISGVFPMQTVASSQRGYAVPSP